MLNAPSTDQRPPTLRNSALELLARKRARGNLIDFTAYTMPQFEAAGHHRRIAEALEKVERGEIDRLMIFAPPRHTKTELATKRFVAWYLGRHPDRQVISASYNSDLSTDYGRAVRNIVAGPEFANLFPGVALAEDSKAAERWNTNNGGAYVAAGVGTSITGRGAHLVLIDDPLKGRQEADSETRRDLVWKWYLADVRTRLMPNAAIVIIQTRWHEDDLAGRLLAQAKATGEGWHVVDLPAICSDGTALWPEWFPLEDLRRTEREIGSREWNALYMQNPTPEEGNFFKREWFKTYKAEHKPEYLRIYGASDYAVTADGGDYTVHGIAGVDTKGDLYVLDWWRGQTTTDVWIDILLDMAARHKPLMWAEESGQILKSLGPFIDRRMEEREVFFPREQFVSGHAKDIRAQAIRGRLSQGKVYFPEYAPWLSPLMSEMLSFPAGKNDDCVDVMSLFGRMLDQMSPAEKPNDTEDADLIKRLRRGII